MVKRKKILLVSLGALMVLSVFAYLSNMIVASKNETREFSVNGRVFFVEVVDTQEKMRKGLGLRDDLCRECGMLFDFHAAAKHDFWMKDMRFPLDIIWIMDGKIVHIEKNVQHDFVGTLRSSSDSDRVLEINAGIVDESGIKVGDRVGF